MKVMLGGHEDVLAVEEEPRVRAQGRIEAPLLVLGGLLVGGCGHVDVVEEAERRSGDGVELRGVVGDGLAVTAGEGVRHRV